MQDGGKVGPGQGMYFHVAMMNGQANQLSEMVPVSVIQSEIGRYINAGATSYFLVNTSDERPVAMTTRAVMEMAWAGNLTGVPATTGGAADPEGGADTAFYKKWATEEFGARSADTLAKVYKEYFAAPSPRASFGPPRMSSAGNAPQQLPRYSNVPLADGDEHYHSEARRILLDTWSGHQVVNIPSQSPKWTQPRAGFAINDEQRAAYLDRAIKECTDAQPRWDAVWKDAEAAESLVDPSRRDYYHAEMLTMITINRNSNRMLLDVAESMKAYDAGDATKAQTEAADALKALDEIQTSMHAA